LIGFGFGVVNFLPPKRLPEDDDKLLLGFPV
jgi:hypothetical protein